MTQRLIETLSDLQISVSLLDRRMSKTASEVGRGSVRKMFAALDYWRRAIQCGRNRHDIILVFLADRVPSYMLDEVAIRLLSTKQSQVLVYLHSANVSRLTNLRLIGPVLRRRLGNSRSVIVLNELLASEFAEVVARDRMVVIPNSPSVPTLELGREEPGARNGSPPRFVYLSNWIPAKGALDFVRFAEAVLDDVPDAEFDLCGSTSDVVFQRQVIEAVASSRAAARINVHGAVLGADKWRILRSGACLVFPSTHPQEAQPLVVIEAMSQGLPVVAYDVGGLRAMANGRPCLRTVRAGDFRELAVAAVDIASKDLSGDALHTWREIYGPEAFSNAWRDLLNP